MNRTLFTILPLCLSATVLAQEVDLTVRQPADAVRISVKSKLTSNETRKMLVNGEEGGFGGGRGGRGGAGGMGGGETTITQEVVFDEGSNWREYKKLTAVEKRMGPDGEERETPSEGALQGKKVYLKAGEAGVELTEGEGDKAQPVAAMLSRGVPGHVTLAGFAPNKKVAVGDEFELGRDFVASLRGLVHPVTRDFGGGRGGRGQGGQGAEGGGRGQGGQGAEGGGRGQGGQGAEGGGRGGRGQGSQGAQGRQGGGRGTMGGTASTVMQLLSSDKIGVEAKGKLVGVDKGIATVAINAKLTGKGSGEELGLGRPMGGFGGRGGRGGQNQDAPSGTDAVDANFAIEGTVRIDVASQQVVGGTFTGNLEMKRDTANTMQGRDGEEMKIESSAATKAKLELSLECIPAK